MEQQDSLVPGDAPLSRRALREAAEREARRPNRSRRAAAAPARAAVAPGHRWIPRAAILTSLAVATIAVPLTAGAGSGSGSGTPGTSEVVAAPDVAPVGPSTLSIVSSAGVEEAPPASVAQAVSAEERTVLAASRAVERSPLPGCDSSAKPQGTNGKLSTEGLCELWGTGNYARADAAVALAALNEAYVQKYGSNMCITDGYRSLSSQYTLKSTKGGLAATPGKSEHGWGLAVDLCASTYQGTAKTQWLRTNAPLFGWDNPAWARPGGSGATEPWHWEFTEGVEAHS